MISCKINFTCELFYEFLNKLRLRKKLGRIWKILKLGEILIQCPVSHSAINLVVVVISAVVNKIVEMAQWGLWLCRRSVSTICMHSCRSWCSTMIYGVSEMASGMAFGCKFMLQSFVEIASS